jgi:CheY-like chemotaxis protein
MENLEILVVDDNPIHQESAKRLEDLGHSVKVVGNYSDAIKELGGNPYGTKESLDNKYHVVITDLMLPSGDMGGMFDRDLEEEIVPLGFAIALYAAKQGTPNVAILSDGNHHTGPINASLDMFVGENRVAKAPLEVDGSRVLLLDTRSLGSEGEGPKDYLKTLEYIQHYNK